MLKVETTVNVPVEKAWKFWTTPEDIIKWNNASEDWHTPRAENDLREGGKFKSRMEAKDGSAGFDFEGTYTKIETNKLIEYTIIGGRKVKITFNTGKDSTKIVEEFDPENENPLEMQRAGWQSIMDNFKKYAEASI